jgi:predicted transcriptional regulator
MIPNMMPDQLTRRIRRHLKRTGMAPSTFGTKAVGDPHLLRDLEKGREPRRRTVERIVAFIKAEETQISAPRATGREQVAA